MEVNLIVAIGKDGAIGKNGDLIWKIPQDLKRFKQLTTGHPVIMGRKTWESLPKKPLPNRRNIIITKNPEYKADGAETMNSIEEALKKIADETSFIIGGAQIYREFLPYASRIYLTVVEGECPEADAHLALDLSSGWILSDSSPIETTPDGLSFQYLTFSKL